jgi:hypothetical protein
MLCLILAILFFVSCPIPVSDNGAGEYYPELGSRAEGSYYSFGLPTGSYRKIVSYSNGKNIGLNEQSLIGTFGYTYQCVEYVKRFYGTIFKNGLIPRLPDGMAKNMFSLLSNNESYICMKNNENKKPNADDIICFDDKNDPNSWGHVAIIREVYDSYIQIIHQNYYCNSADDRTSINYSVIDGKYCIENLDNYSVIGWIRLKSPEYNSNYIISDNKPSVTLNA